MSNDLTVVSMIAGARAQGLTWAQIAPAIGCPDGKTAKAKAKKLARQAQSAFLRDGAAAILDDAGDDDE